VYKFNWYSVVDKQTNRIRVGIIVRDNKETIIVVRSSSKPGYVELVVAETYMAMFVSEFSKDFGLKKIVLKGDAM
jgi:hypothetical protein